MNFIIPSTETITFLGSELPEALTIFDFRIETYYLIGLITALSIIQTIVVVRKYVNNLKGIK